MDEKLILIRKALANAIKNKQPVFVGIRRNLPPEDKMRAFDVFEEDIVGQVSKILGHGYGNKKPEHLLGIFVKKTMCEE